MYESVWYWSKGSHDYLDIILYNTGIGDLNPVLHCCQLRLCPEGNGLCIYVYVYYVYVYNGLCYVYV